MKMKTRKTNRISLIILIISLMLNSLAAWAFSFISFKSIMLIYAVNTLPVLGFFLLISHFFKKEKIGFSFLGLGFYRVRFFI